jgi:ribonuclease BN (tRNA processing enzyme)/pimeloyl-ACP methyl ester carboxylesterase
LFTNGVLFLEADFWPGTTSVLLVIHPEGYTDGIRRREIFPKMETPMKPTLWCGLLISFVVRLTDAIYPQQPPQTPTVPAAVISDPTPDPTYPATMAWPDVVSHGAKMYSVIYIASGAGPHPTVLMLHGFPGNEKDLDLAHSIRRAGWNVLVPFYRGAWGSGGTFSFTHALEDARASIDFLRDPDNARKFRIDSSRIVLLGHSMGGFVAAYVTAHDPQVLAVVVITPGNLGPSSARRRTSDPQFWEQWRDNSSRLVGTTPQQLMQEVDSEPAKWNYMNCVPLLKNRPAIVLEADDQNTSDNQELAKRLREAGDAQVTELHMHTDHSFSDHRIAMQAAVVNWLDAITPLGSVSQGPKASTTRTRVLLLGTGTPVPDPDRSGPATAIVVDDRAYLIDFGPGVVRRAETAALGGVTAAEPGNLRVAFVTHLHSDHTAGYSDLILTGWTSGRTVPLEVYGPSGLQSMTEHILQAYRADIETRTNPDGNQRRFPDGWKVNAHEIKPGVIYKDEKVTVTAFATKHAMESYGYRFDTPDRSIVISGDTNPLDETIKACDGCDVLVHEAQPVELLAKMPGSVQAFVAKYHTTTEQLAELAGKARPKLLVVYHTVSFPPGIAPPRLLPPKAGADALYASPEMLQKEIASRYSGKFVIGNDLDVY